MNIGLDITPWRLMSLFCAFLKEEALFLECFPKCSELHFKWQRKRNVHFVSSSVSCCEAARKSSLWWGCWLSSFSFPPTEALFTSKSNTLPSGITYCQTVCWCTNPQVTSDAQQCSTSCGWSVSAVPRWWYYGLTRLFPIMHHCTTKCLEMYWWPLEDAHRLLLMSYN